MLCMGMPRVAGSSAADGTVRVTWNPMVRPVRAGWNESVWKFADAVHSVQANSI